MNIKLIVLIIYYLFASSLGLILVKQFFNGLGDNFTWSVQSFINYKIIVGAVLYITSFFVWFLILSKNELTFIYPIIVGLGYVFIIVLSLIVLKEVPNFYRYLGIFIILTGVLLIVIKGK